MIIEWFILGHLTEEEALTLASNCEKHLNYKKANEDDITFDRLVKLPNQSVFDYDELNEDP